MVAKQFPPKVGEGKMFPVLNHPSPSHSQDTHTHSWQKNIEITAMQWKTLQDASPTPLIQSEKSQVQRGQEKWWQKKSNYEDEPKLCRGMSS